MSMQKKKRTDNWARQKCSMYWILYDYDCIDKDGQKSELHIDKALEVANLHNSIEPKQPIRVVKYR